MSAVPDDSGNVPSGPLRLFEAFGVEIEYMIVDAASLDVRPIADAALGAAAAEAGAVAEYENGSWVPTEVRAGVVAWSNELTRHLLELKGAGPCRTLAGLGGAMQAGVGRMNALLAPMGAVLLPGGMHPWMDPERQTELWPFGYGRFYQTFNRIFDCRGHGWANLQATHLNLPFHGDGEFGRLHAAVRALLPIMPALAASSPVYGGRASGALDSRMEVYRGNSRAVPSVAGAIIPEPVYTRADYERVILAPMYADLAAHDPEGLLAHEWTNSRGCIARFDRESIEVRVLDAQECPAADLAVCGAVMGAARRLCEVEGSDQGQLRALEVDRLAPILLATIRDGEKARVHDTEYLRMIGVGAVAPGGLSAGEVWMSLVEQSAAGEAGYGEWKDALETILRRGTLSTRILRDLDGDCGEASLVRVYRRLADCLAEGRMY